MLKLKRKRKVDEMDYIPSVELPFETPLYMIKRSKNVRKKNNKGRS